MHRQTPLQTARCPDADGWLNQGPCKAASLLLGAFNPGLWMRTAARSSTPFGGIIDVTRQFTLRNAH
jgi:hypothetical protein